MDDYISRQAAIDAVKKNTFRLTFAEEQNCEGHVAWSAEAVYSDVMEGALLELPSAQPERIKGHWIDAVIPNDSGGLPVIVCDKCNTFFPLQFGAGHNFCPNCGADMRGEK